MILPPKQANPLGLFMPSRSINRFLAGRWGWRENSQGRCLSPTPALGGLSGTTTELGNLTWRFHVIAMRRQGFGLAGGNDSQAASTGVFHQTNAPRKFLVRRPNRENRLGRISPSHSADQALPVRIKLTVRTPQLVLFTKSQRGGNIRHSRQNRKSGLPFSTHRKPTARFCARGCDWRSGSHGRC